MMITPLQAFICIHYSNEYLVQRKRGILYFSFPDILFCVKTFRCKQQYNFCSRVWYKNNAKNESETIKIIQLTSKQFL